MNTIIEQLESDNSRLAKQAVLESVLKDQGNKGEFARGARMAYDAMITFGVKQVPESRKSGPGLAFDEFVALAQSLSQRQLTGDAARDAINQAMSQATKEQWNGWYRRILIKDLRCGVTEKSINDVAVKLFNDAIIPVFSCQLAHDGANHESKVSGKKLIEVKLDGVRVLTIVHPSGKVDQYSRNGKELVNFEHIKQQFADVASTLKEPMVFDGEVMSSSFQDLMKQVHRKSDVSAGDAVLHLFDVIPLANFQEGHYKVKQQERSRWLKDWFERNMSKLANVSVLDQALVDLDTERGQMLFKMYNKSAVENGYEGIMIKDPDAYYQCKRSVAWLKQKPFIEVSLEVTDVEEGTGKNQGRLGALVCQGVDDGKSICVNVGSGLSDSLRDSIWGNARSVIGQVVEVRADAVTQNQDGSYSLRFPRFKSFRGFEPGEKL